MFFKAIVSIAVILGAFIAGGILGHNEGSNSNLEVKLNKIQRFERTTGVAYAFVPLRSILEQDTDNAVNVLNNELISGIKQLTQLYDENDTNSAKEIMEIITIITEWRNNSNINYNNVVELDEVLYEFNKKHNKALNSDATKSVAPVS